MQLYVQTDAVVGEFTEFVCRGYAPSVSPLCRGSIVLGFSTDVGTYVVVLICFFVEVLVLGEIFLGFCFAPRIVVAQLLGFDGSQIAIGS